MSEMLSVQIGPPTCKAFDKIYLGCSLGAFNKC